MPARRSHKKSRNGCGPCKRRHLKCDEIHPECANCHDHGLKCLYIPARTLDSSRRKLRCPEAHAVTELETLSPESRTIPSASQESVALSISPQLYNVTAGKLLHHYTTSVYDTLSTIPSQQKVWQTSVVQIAFGHEFLLRGILAVSALHLAHTESNMAPQLIVEAAEHQQAALAEFRPLVGLMDVSSGILQSMFLLSCFLSMSAFGLPRAEGRFKLPNPTGVEDFLTCAYLVRGMTALVERWRASVLHSGIDNLTRPGIQSETLPVIDSEPVAELLAFSNLYASCNAEPCAETSFTYLRAVQVLHEQFTQLAALPRHGDSQSPILLALIWPATVSQEYLLHLEERKPRAILILAYYGVLLHRLDFFWCFRGWGKHLVQTSVSATEDMHEELLAWPRAVVGLYP
ncbi:hypothetical protein BKA64DRAFT_693634 [Cadophora sp. MPI-SDFR-AT-0126]|nr:hypothetical protein BKA64DRAFT_693634 [Leotiomycetes sp. MPI-SDFR-AT-0126]